MTKQKFAIIYDFDGTLAKGNMQERSFIPEVGMTTNDFWGEVKKIAKKNDMDEVSAYMSFMITKAAQKKVETTRTAIEDHGKHPEYFEGLMGENNWFTRIKSYADDKGFELSHYIISSGLKEMIEACKLNKYFKHVYASSFMYDHNGVAQWPATIVNYTTKVQYLFRINKGIENSWDNKSVNQHMAEVARPVPFEHMIYIGDGLTDVPAMKMVRYQGGVAIGVYEPENDDSRRKVQEALKNGRADYIAPADYHQGRELDGIVKACLERAYLTQTLKKYSPDYKKPSKGTKPSKDADGIGE